MINRRNFLGTLALLPTAPSLLAGYKGDSCLDSGSFYPMDLRLIKDGWGNTKLKVAKGPYSIEIFDAKDCIDCHGLCATAEVVHISVQELELGENQRLVLSWDNSALKSEERIKWINSLKRCQVTKQERVDIYNVLKKLRGPHNCCWDSKKVEKWGVNQLCTWG